MTFRQNLKNAPHIDNPLHTYFPGRLSKSFSRIFLATFYSHSYLRTVMAKKLISAPPKKLIFILMQKKTI
ncbi:hypothetical protein HMPREF0201_04494 [Cedecea davisae DSM 4568]|uniref:Uncharacterized protein n=1 Tax=Cedecea davisae DSM 4568 TaxID=566551 RepID=S3IKF8_9ENTR|nr:hypothetical protein HMPREF0201_04494 [Cedecea davisae DSM 4568]